jgi:hypothetical protein
LLDKQYGEGHTRQPGDSGQDPACEGHVSQITVTAGRRLAYGCPWGNDEGPPPRVRGDGPGPWFRPNSANGLVPANAAVGAWFRPNSAAKTQQHRRNRWSAGSTGTSGATGSWSAPVRSSRNRDVTDPAVPGAGRTGRGIAGTLRARGSHGGLRPVRVPRSRRSREDGFDRGGTDESIEAAPS